MTDLSKMKELLDNQAERGVKRGDWKRLEFKIEHRRADISLTIENLEVGFVFSLKGRLIGAYNWKQ